MSSDTVISVTGLGKCYQIYEKPQDRLKQSLWRGRRRFYEEFWALRDLTFEIEKGETIGVIGRNGSGKTTLLQLIAGTLAPTTGEVETNGRVAALLELGSGFNPEFTGRENVILNGVILGIPRREMERRLDDIAAFADIGEFMDQPVKFYSSGMLVRVAFAVSVHVDAEVLIVDEALAVGDAAFQFKCIDRMDQLKKTGVTLLFVSHDINMVRTFCKKVIYLDHGEMRAMGPAEDVTEAYALDLRNEQRQATKPEAALKPRAGTTGEGSLSFGSGEGEVVMAEFSDSKVAMSQFALGDQVRIRAALEYLPTVKNPTVTMFVQDRRLIPILGKYFRLTSASRKNGRLRSEVEISFKASLAPGDYRVTIRLEDRLPNGDLTVVDKQIGILTFQVFTSGRPDFMGIVDFDVNCVEKPA